MWAGLIVYASLHPFAPWVWPELSPGKRWVDLLWLPMSRATAFDLWANFLAYQPFGLLLALAWLRAGSPAWRATLQASLCGVLLSLTMECVQYLLPIRVPSRVDWFLNSAGTLTGAVAAVLLQRGGVLHYWQRLRDTLFVPHGTMGLLLLLSWPIGLLFPPPVPLATGQGLERLAGALHEWLADTVLADWVTRPQPEGALAPGTEALVVALGLLAPALVSFVMLRRIRHRLVTLIGTTVVGVGTTALSTMLNFGPEHAMSWLTPPVLPGVLIGLGFGFGLAFVPRRGIAAFGLVLLTLLLSLVNQAGSDPYFALSLSAWEQGRFIRFHGLAQWVGWLWPLAALAFLLHQTTASQSPDQPASGSRGF
jgi:VanZ family protein